MIRFLGRGVLARAPLPGFPAGQAVMRGLVQ
jgi:hypothetical protein